MTEMQETWLDPWVGKIPLKKEMATHSSILAWETPRMEEPGGLWSMAIPEESAMTERTHTHMHDLRVLVFSSIKWENNIQ